MWIRTITLALALSVVLSSLVGCSDNSNTVPSNENESSSTSVYEASTVTETDSNDEGEQQKAEEEVKQKAEEEAKQKAEEEAKQKAEEEAKQKAEQEAEKKAEEEAKQKAEEEAKQKAEEEAKQKAEEEAKRKAEEEKQKAEEEKKKQNSLSMMYYLAITAEEIRSTKDNRAVLDEIYTSLLNDINPGAVDETTQSHLKNLRDIIKKYQSISTKRERLQFLYNQQKAAAIRSAVPNPIAILSTTRSLDWKQLAVNVVYTAVDSLTKYKNASESADTQFITSGWELDDEEVENIQKNRDRAFDYMVDMVQEYGFDGKITLNEKAVEKFSEICSIESSTEKIKRLLAEESTYYLLGNYWLELADCYFETSQYKKCLDCIDKYNELSMGIFRQDYNYAAILPKAIVAAQNTYSGKEYETKISTFNKALIENTSTEDWSSRYFAAQVYLDLYSRTTKKEYLKEAYKLADSNVTVLLSEQRKINSEYINDVVEVEATEPDYRYMSKEEEKTAKDEYNAEKKRVKEYNKSLKEKRKTELPALYEPLVLNCELLFALADELNITASEKLEIQETLGTSTNSIFLVNPINDKYSFGGSKVKYDINVSKDEIVIPVSLLTAEAQITISVKNGSTEKVINDAVIKKVERAEKDINSFTATVTSKQYEDIEWSANSEVTVIIKYSDAYDYELKLTYYVSEYESHWYGDKVVFTRK